MWRRNVAEFGILAVPIRENGRIEGPIDVNRLVRPKDAAIIARGVWVSALIDNVSGLTEYAKTVGKTFRYEHLQAVVFGQIHSHPFAEGWRTAADVNSDIKDSAGDGVHQFCLGQVQLIM